eukprot:m.24428 g.24428  ORF g.24428 m.24428 type:complete len:375 (+) comp6074_c0_seq2:227-1351(+)
MIRGLRSAVAAVQAGLPAAHHQLAPCPRSTTFLLFRAFRILPASRCLAIACSSRRPVNEGAPCVALAAHPAMTNPRRLHHLMAGPFGLGPQPSIPWGVRPYAFAESGCRALATRARRDAYEILGVDRSATDKEIKLAYLQAARQVHPDVNDSPEATVEFQEISDAYEAINTSQKRARYSFDPNSDSSSGHSGGGAPFTSSVDPEAVFNTVLHDLGVGSEIVKHYLHDLQDDMEEVSDAVKRGEYGPLADFVNRRKGLFVATLLPLLVVLRMPGLALGALSVIPRIGLTFLSAFARLPPRAHVAFLNAVVLKYLDMQSALHRYADEQSRKRVRKEAERSSKTTTEGKETTDGGQQENRRPGGRAIPAKSRRRTDV